MRLRLRLDPVSDVTCQTIGGYVTRDILGDIPCGRWCRTADWGFASDHLSSVARLQDAFCVNLLRGAIACTDAENTGRDFPERTVTDAGRQSFRCVFTPCPETAPSIADSLEFPPMLMMHWPHDGVADLPADFAASTPELALLALSPLSENRLEATLQNCSPKPLHATFAGQTLDLAPWEIAVRNI